MVEHRKEGSSTETANSFDNSINDRTNEKRSDVLEKLERTKRTTNNKKKDNKIKMKEKINGSSPNQLLYAPTWWLTTNEKSLAFLMGAKSCRERTLVDR